MPLHRGARDGRRGRAFRATLDFFVSFLGQAKKERRNKQEIIEDRKVNKEDLKTLISTAFRLIPGNYCFDENVHMRRQVGIRRLKTSDDLHNSYIRPV